MTVSDDDVAALVALGGLPDMGPSRLRAVSARGGPAAAWLALAAGRFTPDPELQRAASGADLPALLRRWGVAARATDPAALLARQEAAGVEVLVPGRPGWPAVLDADPEPPAVLYCRGDRSLVGSPPAVAVVGTRRASRYGIEVARELGAALAAAGVCVVSGLAAGVDGAAHAGALDGGGAPPVGVVGSGLDVVYPRGHRLLWARVAEAGALASEWPVGTLPARWRFPARNRLLAAFADAVVVVESPAAGGALLTVDEALRRDRPVLAVPGPIGNPASVGTNRLLADGIPPVCDVGDVLLAVGATRPSAPEPQPLTPGGAAGTVLDAVGWRPATLDQLVLRSGLPIEQVARLLAELEFDGWLAGDGGWWERRR